MIFELVYTSSTKGLVAGKSGFCTVAASREMSANLVAELESLSGYRHVYSPGDPKNPVSLSYVQLRVAGKLFCVVSRVGDAGMDYSGRSNLLAHHIAIAWDNLPSSGPAWVADPKQRLLRSQWQGDPEYLPPLSLPQHTDAPAVCNAWERVTGDAGWGGVPAQAIASKSKKPIAIIYGPETDVFSLIRESSRLLPKNLRWKASYNTFFTSALPGLDYRWRCFFSDTPEAEAVRRDSSHTKIDLTDPASLPSLEDSEYVQAARTGVVPDSTRRDSQHTRRSKATRSATQPASPKDIRALPDASGFEDAVAEELHLQPPGRKSALSGLGTPKATSKPKPRINLVLASAVLLSVMGLCAAGLFIYFNDPDLITRLFDSEARELIRLQDQLDALKLSDSIKNDSNAQTEVSPEQKLQRISEIKESVQFIDANENNKQRKSSLDKGLDQLEIRTKLVIFGQTFRQIRDVKKDKIKKRLKEAQALRKEVQEDPLFEISDNDESREFINKLDRFIAQHESRLALREASANLNRLQTSQNKLLKNCFENPDEKFDQLMGSMEEVESEIKLIQSKLNSLVWLMEENDKRKRIQRQLDEFNKTLETQKEYFSAIQQVASFDLPAELNITLVAYKNKIAERQKDIENLKNGLPESLSPEQAPKLNGWLNEWLEGQRKSLEQYSYYVKELEEIDTLLDKQPDDTAKPEEIQSYVDQLKEKQKQIDEFQQDLQQLKGEGFQKLLVGINTQAENSIKNYEAKLSKTASQQDAPPAGSETQGWWTALPEFFHIGPIDDKLVFAEDEDELPEKEIFKVLKHQLPDGFQISNLQIDLQEPRPAEISLKKNHADNRATWDFMEDGEALVARLVVEENPDNNEVSFRFGYESTNEDRLGGKYKLQNSICDQLAGHVLQLYVTDMSPEQRAFLILDAQSNGNDRSASKIKFQFDSKSSKSLKNEATVYRVNRLEDDSKIRLEIDENDMNKVIEKKFKENPSRVKVSIKGGKLEPINANEMGEDQVLGRLLIKIETWGKPQFQFKVMGNVVREPRDTGMVNTRIWTEFEQIDFMQPENISAQFEQTLDDVVGPYSTKFKDEKVNKDARKRIPLSKDGSSKRKNQAQYFEHAKFLKSKKKEDIISELDLLKSKHIGDKEGVHGQINNLNSQDPPPKDKSKRLKSLHDQVSEISKKIGAVDSTINYVEETVPFLVDELKISKKNFKFKMKVLRQYQFPNGQTRELQLQASKDQK